jgi:hypothetical protein
MKTVLINSNGTVVDDDRVVSVSKVQNENIRWKALDNGGPWKITFDKNAKGSPFTATKYVVPKGLQVISEGGPKGGQLGQTYSYNVRHHNPANPDQIINPPVDDPDVDVE